MLSAAAVARVLSTVEPRGVLLGFAAAVLIVALVVARRGLRGAGGVR